MLNPRGSIAYGGDTLLIYLEGVGFRGPATLPLQVRDGLDSVVLRTTVQFTGQREVESQVIRVSPDSAPLGQLQVVVGEDANAKSVSGIVSFSGNWLVTNFEDLLSLLRYFGEDTRVARMKESTPENRPDLWREFFAATDPNRATPENEALDAYFARLAVANDQFRELGLKPITLAEGLMQDVTEIARRYAHRADLSKVPCVSSWNSKRAEALKDESVVVAPSPAQARSA